MAISPKVIYVDSNVPLEQYDPNGPYKMEVTTIESEAKKGRWRLETTALALVEAFKLKETATPEDVEQLHAYFVQDHMGMHALEINVAVAAQKVRHELHKKSLKIEPYDAVHVATAIAHGIEYLITLDGTSAKTKKTSLLQLDKQFRLKGDPSQPLLRILDPKTFLELCGITFFSAGVNSDNEIKQD